MKSFVAILALAAPLLLSAEPAGQVSATEQGWPGSVPGGWQAPESPALWKADLDNISISDLSVEYHAGAMGTVELVTTPDSNGKKVLRITKRNRAGYITVRPVKGFPLKPGAKIQQAVRIQGHEATPEYSLGFVVIQDPSGRLMRNGNFNGDFPGGPRQKLLINALPGTWERKLSYYQQPEKGGEIRPVIVVSGASSVSLWSDWVLEDYDAAAKVWRKSLPYKGPKVRDDEKIPRDKFKAALDADSDHTAKVGMANGGLQLLVDGKPVVPVIYKSKALSLKNYFAGRILQENGIRIQVTTIRFGKVSGRPYRKGFWSMKDGVDVKAAAERVRDAMRASDKSNFILSFEMDAPYDFGERHPDEVWRTEDGKIVYGSYVHALPLNVQKIPHSYWPWASNHSLVWRNALKEVIAQFVEELKRSGLSKRVIGVHLSGYHDHQFSAIYPDFSKPAKEAFRTWLREKYRTDAALCRAWGRSGLQIATAEPPSFGKELFFQPGKDQDKLDYYTFLKHAPFRMQEDIAAFIKRSFGKEIVVLRWCQAAFSCYYVGAYDITPFLDSPSIDVIVAQPNYQRRLPGTACGVRMPLASFSRHNKLFLNEFDLRTYAGDFMTETACFNASRANDFTAWENQDKRLAGQMIANRHGYWYYDMYGGWFSAPEIAREIGENAETYRKIASAPARKWSPSAAFVIDEEGLRYHNLPYHEHFYSIEKLLSDQMQILAASGVPCDVWLAEDFIRDPGLAKQYRTIVFCGMLNVDQRRRKMLDALRNDGRTLIYLADTGRVGGADATGFQFKESPAGKSHEVFPAPGVKVNVMSAMHNTLVEDFFRATGDSYHPGRFLAQKAPGDKVYATYAVDGAPAILQRKTGNAQSVCLCSGGGLTPELFSQLVKESGGYVPGRPGVQIDMSGDFVSLHALTPGPYRFRPPLPSRVLNIKTGEFVSPDADGQIPMLLNAGEVRWFRLLPR